MKIIEQSQYYEEDQGFEQQIDPRTQMGTFPQHKRLDPEFTKWQYDTTDIFKELDNFLRGQAVNDEGQTIRVHDPMMNTEGINIILGDIKFHFHKGIFLSNFSKEDVRRIALEFRKMIINWVYLNWKKYGIEKTNFNRIVYNTDHIVFSALMKPLDDKERKHLSQTTSRQESIHVMTQDKPKKFGLF